MLQAVSCQLSASFLASASRLIFRPAWQLALARDS